MPNHKITLYVIYVFLLLLQDENSFYKDFLCPSLISIVFWKQKQVHKEFSPFTLGSDGRPQTK